MLASELIAQLNELVEIHGDKKVAIDDGLSLRPIDEIDLGAEEDDTIIIWMD